MEFLITESFLGVTEARILPLQSQRASYTTAVLGSALRDAASFHAKELRRRSEEVIQPMHEYLFGVLKRSDRDIVRLSHVSD